ncbi:MAG: phage integrase N-terminal SAM-like domain-containing protein [Proteobacteria bacterium]|nr:phage integrase N-terminal SAM-like domain-containing protein [Pseudomonadota bacterium]
MERFPSHLAINRNVTASTRNQALSAILFLYKEVLNLLFPLRTLRLSEINLFEIRNAPCSGRCHPRHNSAL